ncbi:ABC transporter permease [Agromyces sp. LHK192]|uniref:ABC transporter permease n=1 Tax=Agromyces sp. LHK192 TaxID=2498704 RepID=UPI000FD76790|nr:ABC transporter permease [Agromyces sp. LHK192]
MIGALFRVATGLVSTVVEAMEELRIHRGRVMLSLIGVALAVCALTTVVAAGAVAEQVGREMQERGGGRPATVQFSVNGAQGPPDAQVLSAAWRNVLDRHDVTFASRTGSGMLDVQFADGVAPVGITAVEPDYGQMFRIRLLEGTWFVDRDARRLAPALIVNEAFWDRLGRPPLETHPTAALVGDQPATGVVIGVTPSQGEWDTTPTAMMPVDAFLALQAEQPDPLMGPVGLNLIAWVPPELEPDLSDSMRDSIAAELGDGFSVDAYRTDYAQHDGDPYLALKLLVAGVAVVILGLGALGLVTISLVTVRTRVREIGIRRSFGATSGRVFFSVLMESVVGTFVAGAVGVGLSIALVRSPLVGMALGGTVLDDAPAFPVDAAVIGILASVAVGAVAGLVPALAAVRVRVIDAIRF